MLGGILFAGVILLEEEESSVGFDLDGLSPADDVRWDIGGCGAVPDVGADGVVDVPEFVSSTLDPPDELTDHDWPPWK